MIRYHDPLPDDYGCSTGEQSKGAHMTTGQAKESLHYQARQEVTAVSSMPGGAVTTYP